MNRTLIAVLAAMLLYRNLLAQTSQSPNNGSTPLSTSAAGPSNTPRIAPGSVIPVRLTRSIDAKKAKKGDEVIAKVTQDLRNAAGTIVLSKDTKIVGHITEAHARNKEQKESDVTIAFDHAILKNDELLQMAMSIQAIIVSPNRTGDNATAEAAPSTYPGAQPGGTSPGTASRQGPMEGPIPATTVPQTAASTPANAPTGTKAQPRISGETQGVIGIANLKLSAASDGTQGSTVSSEKNNVRLDEGTLLLLRVNQ